MTRNYSRPALLLAGLIVVAALSAILRTMGLGELALIAGFFALVFSVESIRYVVRQFLKGYRTGPTSHD